MSLRSKPLGSNLDQKYSAPDAGSSPRKPGLMLNGAVEYLFAGIRDLK
jgi:hypothetical protein